MKDIKIKKKNIKLADKTYTASKFTKSSIERTNKKVDDVYQSEMENQEKPFIKILNTNFNIFKKTYNRLNYIKKKKKKEKELRKNAKKNAKRARDVIAQTYKQIYKFTKLIKKVIKSSFSLFKILIFLLIVLIIIIIPIFNSIFNSYHGVLLSSETDGELIMKDIVEEIDNELNDKINNIKSSNVYDEYKIISNKSEWKEVLSLYSVIEFDNGKNEVITLNKDREQKIKEIFWTMNSLSYEKIINEDIKNTTLCIYINKKSIDEMITYYNFTKEQTNQVKDLVSDYYNSFWFSVISGIPLYGDPNKIVEIARLQVGNVGGEKYWRWYGFEQRVEWCAIFVSWVLDQAGIKLKFSVVSDGVNWFKSMNSWHDKSLYPSAGEIIFFDWEGDGIINHVGIVEYVDNNYVYTIEGNSNDDMCRQKKYAINSNVIYGYGIL